MIDDPDTPIPPTLDITASAPIGLTSADSNVSEFSLDSSKDCPAVLTKNDYQTGLNESGEPINWKFNVCPGSESKMAFKVVLCRKPSRNCFHGVGRRPADNPNRDSTAWFQYFENEPEFLGWVGLEEMLSVSKILLNERENFKASMVPEDTFPNEKASSCFKAIEESASLHDGFVLLREGLRLLGFDVCGDKHTLSALDFIYEKANAHKQRICDEKSTMRSTNEFYSMPKVSEGKGLLCDLNGVKPL